MRKFSWVLLVLLVLTVWIGCQKQIKVIKKGKTTVSQTVVIEEKPQAVIEDEKAVVVGSAKELKGIAAKKIIWKKDGAKMVQIPYLGNKYDRTGNLVSFFYMDTTEVTVGQFKKFLAQTDHPYDNDLWGRIYKISPTEKHPMIYVTWHDATAYAKWAGKRLPTEKESDIAARGGLKNKEYPWGDDESLARDYANYKGTDGKDKWDKCAPVGSFKPNGYGLFDMAGNVLEWCQEWYSSDRDYRVLRGGDWDCSAGLLRVAARYKNSPPTKNTFNGFRCVVDLP